MERLLKTRKDRGTAVFGAERFEDDVHPIKDIRYRSNAKGRPETRAAVMERRKKDVDNMDLLDSVGMKCG